LLFDRLELIESFTQTSIFLKPITLALKKYAVPFGGSNGLAPVILMLELVLPRVRGNLIETTIDKIDHPNVTVSAGPKGQAQAHALAQQNVIASVMGNNHGQPINMIQNEPIISTITAIESVDLYNDFSQMLDILADRCNIGRPKKIGNYYCKS
jgi:hypothetical protein